MDKSPGTGTGARGRIKSCTLTQGWSGIKAHRQLRALRKGARLALESVALESGTDSFSAKLFHDIYNVGCKRIQLGENKSVPDPLHVEPKKHHIAVFNDVIAPF